MMNDGQQPGGSDGRAGFYDQKAAIYRRDDSAIYWRERRVLDLLPARQGLRVLDVGCASGAFLRILAAQGHDAFGVDISPQAVALAREHGSSAQVADVETGDGMAAIGGPYDAITLLDVLEHTFEPGEVVRRLQSYLVPGGCFVVSVPNIGSWPGRLSVMRGRFPSRPEGLFDSGHIRWFTRRDLAASWPGFIVERCTGTPLPLPRWLARVSSRRGLWRLYAMLDHAVAWQGARFPNLWAYQLVFRLRAAEQVEGGQDAAARVGTGAIPPQ